MTLDGLGIDPSQLEILRSIGPGGDVKVHAKCFEYPSSKSDFFVVEIANGGERGKTHFMKTYNEAAYAQDPTMPSGISPAEMEHTYLREFRSRGCAVPESQVIGPYRLVLAFCGNTTLADRLTIARDAEQQEKIFGGLVKKQVDFARAGRDLANSLQPALRERTRKIGDPAWKLGRVYDYWRPGDDPDQRAKFMERTAILRSLPRDPNQLILGDVEAYHVVGDPETWVDLEFLKEGSSAQDLAGLWLSPVSAIKPPAINRLLRQYVELRRENGKPLEEQYRTLRREFQLAAPIDVLRRLTANRRLAVQDGKVHGAFVSRYPGYVGAGEAYKARIGELFEVSRANGLFNNEEKRGLDDAERAINELVSE